MSIREPDISKLKNTSLALYKALSAQPKRATVNDWHLELLRSHEMPESFYAFVYACAHHETSKANVGDWDLSGRFTENLCPSVFDEQKAADWVGKFDFGLRVGRTWGGDIYLALKSGDQWRFHHVSHEGGDVKTFENIDGIVMAADEEGSDIEKYMMM